MNDTEADDREQEQLDRSDYEAWLASGPGGMTTLQLRAAQHAADRAGADSDARKLSGQISTREAREGAG